MALLCGEIPQSTIDSWAHFINENSGKKWDDCTEDFRKYLERLGFTKESYNGQIEQFYSNEEYQIYVKGTFKEVS